MDENITIKMAVVATNGFIGAINKLTAYPHASFYETYRLADAKRTIHEALERFKEMAQTIARKHGTDEGENGIRISADKRQQYESEIKQLCDQEVKLPITHRIKLDPAEVPDKYFTPDDLFFLDALVEVVESPEAQAPLK